MTDEQALRLRVTGRRLDGTSIGEDARTLLRLLDEARAAKWQPIETAPKVEDIELLLWCCDRAVIGNWWDGWNDCEYGPIHPTHWMPLPAPPKEPKP